MQTQIEQWQNFLNQSEQHDRKELIGKIKIGGHPSIIEQFSEYITNFTTSFPNVEFIFKFDRSPNISRSVLNHEVDIAFVANPQRFDELVIKKLKKEIVARYSSTENYSNIIYYNPELINSHFIIKKVKEVKLIETPNYEICAKLALTQNSSAILPEYISRKYQLRNKIGTHFFEANLCYIYRSDHKKDMVLKAVLESVKEMENTKRKNYTL